MDPKPFEHKSESLLGYPAFVLRVGRSIAVASVLIAGSLVIGMLGYHGFENLSWLDAFLNSSMLLGGMGPVDMPRTPDGKLFAGFYALYCGLAVILIAGIILAPLAHRLMHRFHMEGGS